MQFVAKLLITFSGSNNWGNMSEEGGLDEASEDNQGKELG